jgi:TonB family protein
MRAIFLYSLMLIAFTTVVRTILSQETVLSNSETVKREPVKVYKVGGGIIAPVLHDMDFSNAITSNCPYRKESGAVVLQAVVDDQGIPRNISFLKATATDLDLLAVHIAWMDQFAPGKKDGAPVAVGEKIEMKIQACVETASGDTPAHLTLSSPPFQTASPFNHFPAQVIFAHDDSLSSSPDEITNSANSPSKSGGIYRFPSGIKPPVPINLPAVDYSDEARIRHISGEVLIRTDIDIHGLPENARILRPLDPSLDQQALHAVMRYRFKPAMRDGMEPVPVTVTLAVNFRQNPQNN